ncbi:MAG: Rrf2 family transcriptional regulator [Nitrospirae bacterium]|nr:Rrf2 family transcriptional regulator [Nitrospirota bacterium]
MQITREADYAVRCVMYLAAAAGRPAPVGEIADAQGMSTPFTAKILQKLVNAGIAASRRGIKGGFVLGKAPSETTLLEVIEAVQGPLALNVCVVDKKNCDRSSHCSVHPVWMEVQADMKKKLGSYTFERLLKGKPH